MTIGIGVLATSDEARKEKRGPDTAILLADTMGSYGDVDSHARLHKVIMMPEDGLYAAIAGDVSRGAQLVPCICTFLREIPKGERTFGKIQIAIAEGCFMYKHHTFTLFELPKLRLPPHSFNPNQELDPELDKKIQKAWLSRRQHTLGLLPLRAAYHAYEAKLTGEGSAHVNEHIDLVVATASGPLVLYYTQVRTWRKGTPRHQSTELESATKKVLDKKHRSYRGCS